MAEVRLDGSRDGGSGSPTEAALWAALDVSPDGFAVHRVHRDDQGRAVRFTLESINRAGAAPHAAGPTDVVGRDLQDLLPDAEGTGIPQVFRAAADTGVVQTLRTAFDSPDWSGTMDLLVARVDNDRIVATWRDVTEQVRSEQVLVDAYTRAQAAWDCLYGVLDAVQDAVLLLRVTPAAPLAAVVPDDALRDHRVDESGDTPARVVVEYLNAAAAGVQDRSRLIGVTLADVNPNLGLDDHIDHVIDLVVSAATDGPGSMRQLIFSDTDGTAVATYTASHAPDHAPVPAPGPAVAGSAGDVDVVDLVDLTGQGGLGTSGLGVVLVVRHQPQPRSHGEQKAGRGVPRQSGAE